ncbi:MAG: class II fructose-bisphosphate aldolase [Firmicutes bacterium]|nr:class II fructose-bisphosphate aldolase [Bacillota bacterium]
MPFVNLNEILPAAKANHYGVGAFNVIGEPFICGAITAAEKEASPIIIAFAEVHESYVPLEFVAEMVKYWAQRARVPVALHLDHAKNVDTIIRAIRAGFSSVMYDGSTTPFADNVKITQKVVAIAKPVGVTVEAELGILTGVEEVAEGKRPTEDFYTDPEQAAEFVEKTGCDALAVSIGTAHGMYTWETMLDFNRLQKISELVSVPLVLHGGSGLSSNDFRTAISKGISKVNVFTECALAAGRAVREAVNDNSKSFPDFCQLGQKAIEDLVRSKIRIFGSCGKAV